MVKKVKNQIMVYIKLKNNRGVAKLVNTIKKIK